MIGFPMVVLNPGDIFSVSQPVYDGKPFRAEKLLMTAQMDVIRGHYKIKRSRLPLLDRDDIVSACTRLYRWSNGKQFRFRPGKVTIAYKSSTRRFVREYLFSSVSYHHVDPLEYVSLINIWCGKEPVMPPLGPGTSALFFSPEALGNGLTTPTTDMAVSLTLKNEGDVQVRVRAMVSGTSLG